MSGLRELVNVTVKFYYEIRDSEIYGGIGSVGYAMNELEECQNIEAMTEEFLQETCNDMAAILHVAPEKVRMISRQEYEAKVEEDE